jgi:nudix-type nucleoside diphosphatase (YffH/AdpP family)
MNPNIKIIADEVLSDNWYTLRRITYDKIGPGGKLERQSREAYDRGNGATILLYNSTTRTVILTRQFRMPTYVNGNADGMLIEACAGLLDKDDPETCIRRETEEETGFKVTHIEKVFEAYMSPGSVTEILHFFIAEYQKDMKLHEGGGLAEEQEDIEVLELDFDKALTMVADGTIRDAKTIMLLQHLRLRSIL